MVGEGLHFGAGINFHIVNGKNQKTIKKRNPPLEFMHQLFNGFSALLFVSVHNERKSFS